MITLTITPQDAELLLRGTFSYEDFIATLREAGPNVTELKADHAAALRLQLMLQEAIENENL